MAFKKCLLAFFVGLSTFNLIAQFEVQPEETLTWALEDYEDETGVFWTTARFETIRGALYTLQSSPSLEDWTNLQSFYALDHELHLALFQRTAPEPINEGTGTQDPPEAVDPPTSVSVHLQAIGEEGRAMVTWHSVAPDPENPARKSGELVRAILPVAMVPEWRNAPIYFNTFDSHHFFIFGRLNGSLPPNFEITDPLSSEDQVVLSTLQSNLGTIQQEVITCPRIESILPFQLHSIQIQNAFIA